MSTQKPSAPSFGQRLGRAFLALIRAIVLLLIIVAIGALLVWSLPRLYTRFILPVQEHSAQIQDLQDQQDQLAAQLIEQNADLLERIQSLEEQRDSDKQTIDELNARIRSLKDNLDSLTQQQEASQADLKNLQTQLDGLSQTLNALEAQYAALQESINANQEELTLLGDYLTSQEAPLAVMYREVQLVKAMELLTRGRLSLELGDAGQARGEVEDARALLLDLRAFTFGEQTEALDAIIERLDLTLEDFDKAPSLVPNDLENVWQLLLAGLPGNTLPPATSLQIVLTPSVEISATTGYPPEPGEEITATLPLTGEQDTAPPPEATPEPTAYP
ncbi:MAG TPA: hypothetical protein ENJ02_09985 [Chloroflexi bacterium]|nr:hypothetical protein [Chloroflexota bacterium]